jgi:hypothetical protein
MGPDSKEGILASLFRETIAKLYTNEKLLFCFVLFCFLLCFF